MDNDAENVEENEKYSFLLASAIRNEDPEQFFSIYDSILPKNLPDTQLELIKSRARDIADYPEDEFSALVLRARNFSLAKNRDKMSYDVTATGMYKTEDRPSSEDNDDDLDRVQLRPFGGCPMSYQSPSYSRRQESCIIDMEQVDKRTDNDSGICNSSKTTTSVGSYSEHEDSEGDERGCFDYYPSTVKITPTTTYHLDYDEAHEVDSDKNDIESPQSGKGSDSEPTFQGVQMRTYSRRTVPNDEDDFETDDDSDSDSRDLHQRLYARSDRKRHQNYYTPMTRESCEDYENFSTSTFSFENSQRALKERSGSSLRDVDDQINFPMYSRHSPFIGSTSSEHVRIEKKSFHRGEYGSDPPFGQGLDQLNKVGSSIGELISSTKHTVDGMPEGRRISQSPDLAAEDGKKKKKKKRGSKDDLDDKSKRRPDYSDTDENGNPRLECAQLLNPKAYRPMRESPNSSGSSVYSKPTSYDSIPAFYSNRRELEDSSSTSNQEATKKRKKPKKDKTVETVRKSEEIENYQGSKEIDEILSFIENDGTGRKPKKVSNNTTVDVNPVKSTDKNNKKNKERKPKVTPGDIKSTEKKENNPENSVKEGSEENREDSETCRIEMGNSNERFGSPEIKTEDCQRDIKERNHIIGENCVLKDSKLKGEMMNGDITSPEEEAEGISNKKLKSLDLKAGEVLINDKEESDSAEIIIDTSSKVTKDLQIDTNLNNMKQNNMKNSKKKHNIVSDNNKKDTVKSSGEKEPEEKMVEQKSEPKSSVVGDTEDIDKESDYYIFTDLDLPKPVEEEFQVVGKKKKKGVPVSVKEIVSKDANTTQRVPLREERRRPQRSITPPPTSLVNSLAMEDERNRMRDLSPSSFPALGAGRQGRQSFRDGRRSSTGDVPKEILIKPQDDSDLESVKSLPASAQAVSPRLQISYAKMAASPKPNSSVSTCPDEDTEDPSNVSVDLKSAVWKGSLTERRHSIGSSPEGKENEASSIRQKFGSQELVKPEKEEGLFSSPEKSPSVVESVKSNSSQNFSVDNSAAIDSVSITEAVSNTSVTKASDSEFNEPLESYSIKNTIQVTAKNQGANNQIVSKIKVSKSSCEASKTSKSQVSSKKVSAKKQAKSVIFLDRGEKDHENLDIVFGFDPQLEVEEPMVSVSNSVSSSSLQPPAVLAQTKSSENLSVDSNSSKGLPRVPVIHSRSVTNNSSYTNTKDYKHSVRNSKSATFPLEGKNGVKSISTLILSPDSKNPSAQQFSFISEDTCAPTVSDTPVISNEAPSDEGCVTVVYGEECSAVLGAESRHPPKQIRYQKETGDILGCFNRVDVTSYLMREWEIVMNMKEKNPGSILVFNQH
ncbi:biorientation of chromosomes in cell division protein 1-like 1 [Saccostrea echinata]|uniref:biorientation of chromosomes in cell division protein 1-like 1 n=1 Tax=Saccostrea echinata TaxID=191078 RepID=UPI002A829FEE|nr:biorientation of chromosomes in cell division protein 1-like 1 [Saccostrea echinata]